MFFKFYSLIFLWAFFVIAPLYAQNENPRNIPLSEDEIISLVKEKYKGSVVKKFMDSNPRLTRLTVRATLDDNIRKLWAETIKNKNRYYIFGIFFIISGIFGWFWKKCQSNILASPIRSIFNWLLRFLVINSSRAGLFLYLFKKEISPVWSMARKIFDF